MGETEAKQDNRLMFDIRRSNKAYIEGEDHFIVTYAQYVFLRVVGCEGRYTIMTATASEDDGRFRAYDIQSELNAAAKRTSAELGGSPNVKQDVHGREYVEICGCEFVSDAYRAAEIVFRILQESSK